MNKLIIIRGPSGAGKSTVANALMKQVARPTALFNRDYFMFMFSTEGDGSGSSPDQDLLENNILYCLSHGYDVIFEGNFKVDTHKTLLDRIFQTHPDENYIFYLDVSLDETLDRHSKREEQLITADEIKGLYDTTTPMGHTSETIIPEHSSVDETVKFISDKAGL